MKTTLMRAALTTSALSLLGSAALADQVILDDLIVDGSICVGLDCVNGESFGFDTLRLKENNLRIKAQDTSASASFPTNDWQITFNDSSNGGANKFSIDDIDGGRTPFTIEAGAPSHSLYVDDGGRIGLGTSTPVVEAHIVDGDTPTLRLEQDGSSGFTPQTWDVAGNETNFFVRDVTSGSDLVLRLRAGAPANSIFVDTDGDVGLGTANPDEELHISSGEARVGLEMQNSASAFAIVWENDLFRLSKQGSGVVEFEMNGTTGDVTIAGGLITGTAGSCNLGTPCDRVFDPEVYTVPSIEEHAASMWENKFLPAVGPTLPGQPVNMTAKVLTMLNELEHAHIYIEQLHDRISALEVQVVDTPTVIK